MPDDRITTIKFIVEEKEERIIQRGRVFPVRKLRVCMIFSGRVLTAHSLTVLCREACLLQSDSLPWQERTWLRGAKMGFLLPRLTIWSLAYAG